MVVDGSDHLSAGHGSGADRGCRTAADAAVRDGMSRQDSPLPHGRIPVDHQFGFGGPDVGTMPADGEALGQRSRRCLSFDRHVLAIWLFPWRYSLFLFLSHPTHC